MIIFATYKFSIIKRYIISECILLVALVVTYIYSYYLVYNKDNIRGVNYETKLLPVLR